MTDAEASLVDDASGGLVGARINVPGDLDGDGILDLTVGDPFASDRVEEGGRITFVMGRVSGWSVGESLAEFPSVQGDMEQGQLCSVRRLGDTDGDGLDDVALDPGFYNIHGNPWQYAVRGGAMSGAVAASEVDAVLSAECPAEAAIDSGGAGDVDGDGLGDWIIQRTQGEGTLTMVVSGASLGGDLVLPEDAALWVTRGEESIQLFALGDIDGDGLADLSAGTGLPAERAWLLLGSDGGLAQGEDVESAAQVEVDLGVTMDRAIGVGDVEGDGLDDVIVTAAGELLLYPGRESWPDTLTAEDAAARLLVGEASGQPSNVGDINGDGIDDIAVGVGQPSNVYLFFGRANWSGALILDDADVRVEREDDGVDLSVHRANTWRGDLPRYHGDLDGDGLGDLLLYDEHFGGDAGKLYVFAGREDWPSALSAAEHDVAITGTAAGQLVGQKGCTVMGDLDGDGIDDLAAAAWPDPADAGGGEVFVFFGRER